MPPMLTACLPSIYQFLTSTFRILRIPSHISRFPWKPRQRGRKDCFGVSLVWDVLCVHFAVSSFHHIPQTGSHCRSHPTSRQYEAGSGMQPFANFLSQDSNHQGAVHCSQGQAAYLRLNHRKEKKKSVQADLEEEGWIIRPLKS